MKKLRKKRIGNGRVKVFTSITKAAAKTFCEMAREGGRTKAGQYRYSLEEIAEDMTPLKKTGT